VDIVEADSMVTEVCRKFFPECCVGVFEDKRVNLLSFDVLKFLESCSDYDLIVYDLTLHPESFTQELRPVYLGNIFSIASKKLKPGGKIVMQCCSEFDHPSIKLIEELLKQNFKVFNLHYEYIPSFACRWLFASASN
jgi:spermidine synthase